jgi:erythromycin esterase
VRPKNVGAGGAGLWMRVDGPGVRQAFDNMSDRPIIGTSGWQLFSVVLDVEPNAIGIACGVLLSSSGEIVVDDFRIEVVGNDVPVTKPSGSVPSADSATIAASYARQPTTGVNLNFEDSGGVPIPAATISWLRNTAVPFATVSPGSDEADLAPLKQMIGNASLVGMGEATHGTREFFQMKHRVFQYLVHQLGFTHFAIEATWPEANDVNTYVLTGKGNPNAALSNLYFWTWRTQEVLDLIQWMRDWNVTAPPAQRVQFLGFDMQYPGAAMDTVAAFIARVDPDNASFISQRYACLSPYRNRGATFTQTNYASLPSATRGACADGLRQVSQLFATKSATYQVASSAALFANAQHSARIVEQWEDMQSAGPSGTTARDRYMAENIQWLRSQAPSAKMMLWAHNYHVSRLSGAMGNHLQTAYGSGYVSLGFTFGSGTFNAVGGSGTSGALQMFQTNFVPNGSMESAFVGTAQPRLLFDTRLIAGGGAPAAPLAGPIQMRSIGALYAPSSEAAYFSTQVFPGDFDLLIYLATATRSTILPVTQ